MSNTMRIHRIVISGLMFLMFFGEGFAQDKKLQVFGFFQSALSRNIAHSDGILPNGAPLRFYERNYIHANTQQTNIFFRHEINSKFTAWLNIEMLNNFNTSQKWGSAKIEEAWGRFEIAKGTYIKAGKLIPAFNNFNEIKNRTPFLQYILRPPAYETAFSGFLPLDKFSPSDAFLQFTNQSNIGSLYIKTDVYVGNAEENFRTNEYTDEPIVTGTDTTDYLTVGGRLGVQYRSLNLGFSTVSDYENRNNVSALRRWRIGTDFRFYINQFAFEGETIVVFYSTPDASELYNKLFYYGTIQYDFLEKFYLYTSYNFIQDKDYVYLKDGTKMYSFGGGIQIYDNVKFKMQVVDVQSIWQQPFFPASIEINSTLRSFIAAISVMF